MNVLTKEQGAIMKQTLTVVGNRHTFSICDSTGQKKQGLKKSFLHTDTLNVLDRTYKTRDGTEYPIFKEPALQDAFKKAPDIKAIMSFQTFEDGEFFCVARVWKELPKRVNPNLKEQPQDKAA